MHPVPSTDELKAEVETRVSLAADAALEKARGKASEVVDTVEAKVSGLVENVAERASRFASDAEAKVHGFTRNVAGEAASKVGLTPKFFSKAQDTFDRVKDSNAVTIPPLLGAFAIIGFALPVASALGQTSGWAEFAAWALLAGVIQIAAFLVLRRFVVADITGRMERGETSTAIYLAATSIAIGLINAASMTY